jgi:predicted metalloprotease
MRWRQARPSDRIEDRRGMRVGRPVTFGGLGLLVVVAIALFTGQDPLTLLEMLGGGGADLPPAESGPPREAWPGDAAPGATGGPGGPGDEARDFVAAVLGSTEDAWGRIFSAAGRRYEPPTLVLFTDAVQSACGINSAAVGPFYCPGDSRVYLDLSFFSDLDRRFGAPGDFAQAYVIGHEVGHHVQNLLGVSDEVGRARSGLGEAEANALSVRVELQADCFAGVWGHHAGSAQGLLEPGDAEEGLRAAAAIGDDTLQHRGAGRVTPESWTHGSSEQRLSWLRRGLESGDPADCDTFGGSRPERP